MSDVTFDMRENSMEVHEKRSEPWRVTIVDTGDDSMTGGRIKRIQPYIDSTFCLTYGDGVSDVDIRASIDFHRAHGKLATLTAVQPSGRFGALNLEGTCVSSFQEKPQGDGAWINGGFFVLEPGIFSFIQGDDCIWERGPMENLARQGQLEAFLHHGFWQPMDTLRDKLHLEELWQNGLAPWKIW
jgi:glucose-1-phosphate cytidylyltransferase